VSGSLLDLSSPERQQQARLLRWLIEEQRAPTTGDVAEHFGWSYSHALVVLTRLFAQ